MKTMTPDPIISLTSEFQYNANNVFQTQFTGKP